MALTISTITPTSGLTSGQKLVIITGVDFDLATTTVLIPMGVKFGGVAATNVQVQTTGRLTCITPEKDPGAVDVEVENLINPATDTLVGGYTYARPDLKQESGVVFATRSLIRKLKRQIITEVVLSTHTDYDADTGDGLNLTELGRVPAIVLSGPRMPTNRFYSSNEPQLVDIGGGLQEIRREQRVVDLEFDFQLVDKTTYRLHNLMHQMTLFFHKNKFLEVDRVPGTPSQGQVQHEMEMLPGGEPDHAAVGSNSNIQAARGGLVIRGFVVEDETPLGVQETKPIAGEVTLLETEVVP